MFNIVKKKYLLLPIPLRTSVIYMLCSVLQKGISFLVVPIYTRMVATDQYGIYSLYQSWDSILCIFATLNMWNYLFSKGMIKYEKDRERLTSALIGLSFLLTSILLSCYLIIKKMFLNFSGLSYGIMALMFLEFYFRPSYEFWCSKQRFDYDVGKYAVSAFIIATVTPILTIALISLKKHIGITSLGDTLVFGKIIVPVGIYMMILVRTLMKNRKLYDKEIWLYALKFSLPLIPHFLSVVILAQSDRIMIGNMCGTSKTAIYSVAYSVASVMLIVNTAVMDSIIPWTYKKIKQNDMTKLPTVSSVSLGLVAIINIFLTMFAPEIVKIMAPSEYLEAIYIIPPVAISNVFIFMFNLFANIEYYYEETKLVACSSYMSAVLNIVLNYIFIKRYGFIAAGYTTLVCYMVYAFCHCMFMRHVQKKHNAPTELYNLKLLWGIGLLAVCISMSVMILYKHFIMRLLLSLMIVMILFFSKKKLVNIFMLV